MENLQVYRARFGGAAKLHDRGRSQARRHELRSAAPGPADRSKPGRARLIRDVKMGWRQTGLIAFVHCNISRFDMFGEKLGIE